MNPYADYEKSDISNVVITQEYFRYEDHEEPLLLDMDAPIRVKDEEMVMSRSFLHHNVYPPHDGNGGHVAKKFPFGDNLEPERVSNTEWETKPVEEWCVEDTANWIMFMITTPMDLPYTINIYKLFVPGKELLALSRHEFIARAPDHGEKLYNMLHSQAVSNRCKSDQSKADNYSSTMQHKHSKNSEPSSGFQSHCHEDEPSAMGSNNVSDAESDNSVEISTKRPPGRPRLLKTKKNPTSQGKLWEFIRDLLRNRKTCPSLICWEDYSQAKFRFVRSDEVAKLWGSRKGNTKMTYEKLSRAMRYYYKRKIFLPVLGRRLVYQFGPNATGWQTDNPNFRF